MCMCIAIPFQNHPYKYQKRFYEFAGTDPIKILILDIQGCLLCFDMFYILLNKSYILYIDGTI